MIGCKQLMHVLQYRSLSALCFGYNEKEQLAWPWRLVFVSNFMASVFTAYFVTDPLMNDLIILHGLNLAFQGMWWFCFLMCLFVSPGVVVDRDPGKVKDHSATYEKAVEIMGNSTGATDEPPYPAVCHTCHVRRPLRAKHCKNLGRCIHKFDHFCPFVGNTVGRDNYRYFVGLLFVHIVCAVLWEITAYWYSCRVTVSWYFVAFMVYSAFWAFALCGLLNYHCLLLMRNLTTNEQIGLHKYAYFKNSMGLIHNPFDREPWSNCWDGLFPSQMVYYSREEFIYYERPDLRAELCKGDNSHHGDLETERSQLLA